MFTKENPLRFLVPQPLRLRVERIDRPGAGPGEQPISFTRVGPEEALVAINAYPVKLVEAFLSTDAFGEPVMVVGAAWEDEGGIRGELSALLPEATIRTINETISGQDEEKSAEPWLESARPGGQTFEEAMGESDTNAEPSHFPLILGAILRFPENRKFANDFELEVDDLMRSILDGNAMDAATKRIDNLLGDI